MKYKVGDKVRVKSFEKLKKEFGVDSRGNVNTRPIMNAKMQKRCGDIVTIAETYGAIYTIKDDADFWNWTDNMFEGLAEETVSELDIYKRAFELACNDVRKYRSDNEKKVQRIDVANEYIEFAKQQPTPILDKEEKAYLSAIIRPFKKNVKYIKKQYAEWTDEQYIDIVVNSFVISLPYFKNDTMYKGMEVDERYTLKELGLEE